jgi:hypothetical protein
MTSSERSKSKAAGFQATPSDPSVSGLDRPARLSPVFV